MADRKLNIGHIRDFLDYIEAEVMSGVYEGKRGGGTHPEFVSGLADFIEKYGVELPVVVARSPLTPDDLQRIRSAFLRDWRQHQQAVQQLRPLLDYVLAVAEGRSPEDQARLHDEAFPEGSKAIGGHG